MRLSLALLIMNVVSAGQTKQEQFLKPLPPEVINKTASLVVVTTIPGGGTVYVDGQKAPPDTLGAAARFFLHKSSTPRTLRFELAGYRSIEKAVDPGAHVLIGVGVDFATGKVDVDEWDTIPVWESKSTDDRLHGTEYTQFTLLGKYLTPPRLGAGHPPAMVVRCSQGKFQNFYVAVGAVVDHQSDGFIRNLEARFDDLKVPFWGIPAEISTDGTAIFFRSGALVPILKSHLSVIGVQEFLGPQIVMEFAVPDPAEIVEACGKDKAIGKLGTK